MKKTYKILVIVVIVAIIVIAGIYFFFLRNGEQSPFISQGTNDNENINAQSPVDPLDTLEPVERKAAYTVLPPFFPEGDCNDVEEEPNKSDCLDKLIYRAALIDTGENYECLKIKNLDLRNSCLFDVMNSNQEFECNKIYSEQKRNSCWNEAATNKKDPEICENIIGREIMERMECRARVEAFIAEDNLAIDECFNIKVTEYGNHCFRIIFLEEGYEYCRGLEDKYLKDRCFTYHLINEGINNKDKERCNLIPLESYKRVCLNRIDWKGSPMELDSDEDGLDDSNELAYDLDPFNPDTDGDGLLDGKELKIYYTAADVFDMDGDGLSDGEEVTKYFTHPIMTDTDGDGVSDYDEVQAGTDPVDNDSDHDFLTNDLEKL